MSDPTPEVWTWPDGELLMHRITPASSPHFVKVSHGTNVDRYGVHYITRPELGYPNGGAGFFSSADQFHRPDSFDERLDVMLYVTAAKVRELRTALAKAERQMFAVRETAELAGRNLLEAP